MLLYLFQTVPIPQNPTDAKYLIQKAREQCKNASNKVELADAKLQEALVRAKLCRSRARHAKQTLNAAKAYLTHVQWTLKRSKYSNVLSQRSHIITVTDGERGSQGMCSAIRTNSTDHSRSRESFC